MQVCVLHVDNVVDGGTSDRDHLVSVCFLFLLGGVNDDAPSQCGQCRAAGLFGNGTTARSTDERTSVESRQVWQQKTIIIIIIIIRVVVYFF